MAQRRLPEPERRVSPPSAPVSPSTLPDTTDRLAALDGLRGIAVLMVVLYHAFARWAEPNHEPTLYPYGNALVAAPWLSTFGQIGVLTFFITSGFVIMWTLERSTGLLDFVGRRIARLWPAMLVCATLSTLLINTSDVAGHFGVDRWNVTALEYVSSVLFFPPQYLADVLGIGGRHQWVEGVYWTLWHEVRFYALVAIVYWGAPRPRFLCAWAAIQIASTALLIAGTVWGSTPWIRLLALPLQPEMLAWFSLGLCGYYLWSGRTPAALAAVAVPSLATIFIAHSLADGSSEAPSMPSALGVGLEYGIVAVFFALIVGRVAAAGILAFPPLVTVGLASYPLYLFHERPGLVIMMLGEKAGLHPLLILFGVIALPIAAALALHRLVERPGKRFVLALWRRTFE